MDTSRRSDSRDFHRLVSLRLEQLTRQSMRYADADYRAKIGLGVLHCRLIGIVGAKSPLNFRQLCAISDVEKSYASRLVVQLIDLGFLRKSADPSDQRSFKLSLTAAGRRAYNHIYRIALHRNDTWMSALTPEQREAFFNCLDILERESSKHIAKVRKGARKGARQGADTSGTTPRRIAKRPSTAHVNETEGQKQRRLSEGLTKKGAREFRPIADGVPRARRSTPEVGYTRLPART